MKKTLLFILSLTFSLVVSGQSNFQLIQSTQANNLNATKRYAADVAASDSVIVIGAYLSNTNGVIQFLRSGAAHVLERDSSGWVEVQEIAARFPAVDDRFGFAVSADKHTIVLGAPQEDEDENDGWRISNAGSVYVFTKDSTGNWVQTQKIVASDRSAGAAFGSSVQLLGHQLIIGAMYESTPTMADAGAAYIFIRDTITGRFQELQKLTPSLRNEDARFGISVSIDDNYAIVGAGWEDVDTGAVVQNAGAAYIFAKGRDGRFLETDRILAPLMENDLYFGADVFVKGRQLVIGAYGEDTDSLGLNPLTDAGAVFYYERDSTNQFNMVQKLTSWERQNGDFFGRSVSMEDNYMLVGAIYQDSDIQGNNVIRNAGAAYIFRKDNNGYWRQGQKLTADSVNRSEDAYFGFSSVLHKNLIVLGAPYQRAVDSIRSKNQGGRAYIFENNCLNFSTQKVEACGAYTWIDGIRYTYSDPDPTFIFSTSNSCDSVLHLDLELLADTGVIFTDPILSAADTNADLYQWVDCDNAYSPIHGASSAVFTPEANGSYALVITVNGCSDTSKCYEIRKISSPEMKELQFKIYPNPGNKELSIICSYPHNSIDIQVKDATGRVVHSSIWQRKAKYTLQTTHWSNGVYFVSISIDGASPHPMIWIKK